jgi:hypothetical protein
VSRRIKRPAKPKRGEKAAAVTAYDRAKEAGIIGVVRNAPADVSTNRKHFDGFGQV